MRESSVKVAMLVLTVVLIAVWVMVFWVVLVTR